MKTEPSWSSPKSRCVLCGVWLCLCCAAAGCSFLENEFTWLDRAGPAVHSPPDAAVSGTVSPP